MRKSRLQYDRPVREQSNRKYNATPRERGGYVPYLHGNAQQGAALDFSDPLHLQDDRTSFFCDLCKQQMSSEASYLAHCNSIFHKDKEGNLNKLVKKHEWMCHTCEKPFLSKIALDQHCLLVRHQPMYRIQGFSNQNDGAESNERDTGEPGKAHESGQGTKPLFSFASLTPPYYCSACQVECGSDSNLKAHQMTWRHRAALDKMKGEGDSKRNSYELVTLVTEKGDSMPGQAQTIHGKKISNAKHIGYYCDICDMHANSHDGYFAHLNGKKHRKKTSNMRPPFSCIFCESEFHLVKDFDGHYKSTEHISKASRPISKWGIEAELKDEERQMKDQERKRDKEKFGIKERDARSRREESKDRSRDRERGRGRSRGSREDYRIDERNYRGRDRGKERFASDSTDGSRKRDEVSQNDEKRGSCRCSKKRDKSVDELDNNDKYEGSREEETLKKRKRRGRSSSAGRSLRSSSSDWSVLSGPIPVGKLSKAKDHQREGTKENEGGRREGGNENKGDIKEGRKVEIKNESDNLELADLREKLNRGKNIVITKKMNNNEKENSWKEGDESIDYDVDLKEDEEKILNHHKADLVLREQLLKEHTREILKYKDAEDEYKRLCLEEDYLRRRLNLFCDDDPRIDSDKADLQKVQEAVKNVREELEIRDEMIQEKEKYLIVLKNRIKERTDMIAKAELDDSHFETGLQQTAKYADDAVEGLPGSIPDTSLEIDADEEMPAKAEEPLEKRSIDEGDLRAEIERERILRKLAPGMVGLDSDIRQRIVDALLASNEFSQHNDYNDSKSEMHGLKESKLPGSSQAHAKHEKKQDKVSILSNLSWKRARVKDTRSQYDLAYSASSTEQGTLPPLIDGTGRCRQESLQVKEDDKMQQMRVETGVDDSREELERKWRQKEEELRRREEELQQRELELLDRDKQRQRAGLTGLQKKSSDLAKESSSKNASSSRLFNSGKRGRKEMDEWDRKAISVEGKGQLSSHAPQRSDSDTIRDDRKRGRSPLDRIDRRGSCNDRGSQNVNRRKATSPSWKRKGSEISVSYEETSPSRGQKEAMCRPLRDSSFKPKESHSTIMNRTRDAKGRRIGNSDKARNLDSGKREDDAKRLPGRRASLQDKSTSVSGRREQFALWKSALPLEDAVGSSGDEESEKCKEDIWDTAFGTGIEEPADKVAINIFSDLEIDNDYLKGKLHREKNIPSWKGNSKSNPDPKETERCAANLASVPSGQDFSKEARGIIEGHSATIQLAATKGESGKMTVETKDLVEEKKLPFGDGQVGDSQQDCRRPLEQPTWNTVPPLSGETKKQNENVPQATPQLRGILKRGILKKPTTNFDVKAAKSPRTVDSFAAQEQDASESKEAANQEKQQKGVDEAPLQGDKGQPGVITPEDLAKVQVIIEGFKKQYGPDWDSSQIEADLKRILEKQQVSELAESPRASRDEKMRYSEKPPTVSDSNAQQSCVVDPVEDSQSFGRKTLFPIRIPEKISNVNQDKCLSTITASVSMKVVNTEVTMHSSSVMQWPKGPDQAQGELRSAPQRVDVFGRHRELGDVQGFIPQKPSDIKQNFEPFDDQRIQSFTSKQRESPLPDLAQNYLRRDTVQGIHPERAALLSEEGNSARMNPVLGHTDMTRNLTKDVSSRPLDDNSAHRQVPSRSFDSQLQSRPLQGDFDKRFGDHYEQLYSKLDLPFEKQNIHFKGENTGNDFIPGLGGAFHYDANRGIHSTLESRSHQTRVDQTLSSNVCSHAEFDPKMQQVHVKENPHTSKDDRPVFGGRLDERWNQQSDMEKGLGQKSNFNVHYVERAWQTNLPERHGNDIEGKRGPSWQPSASSDLLPTPPMPRYHQQPDRLAKPRQPFDSHFKHIYRMKPEELSFGMFYCVVCRQCISSESARTIHVQTEGHLIGVSRYSVQQPYARQDISMSTAPIVHPTPSGHLGAHEVRPFQQQQPSIVHMAARPARPQFIPLCRYPPPHGSMGPRY